MDIEIQKKVDQLKAAGHSVLKLKLMNREFIYRSLNRQEYNELQKKIAASAKQLMSDNADENVEMLAREKAEEELVLRALVAPEVDTVLDFKTFPAGIIQTLSEYIMRASGFGIEAEPEEL